MVEKIKNKNSESIRLRQLRLNVGATLNSLYKITGVATATISNIEKGNKSYQNSSLANIASAFGIDISYFFDLSKELPPQENLVNSLILYSKPRMTSIAVKSLLKKNLTSLVLDEYIENRLLDEYQSVGSIIDSIKQEYLILLKSPQTSKILSNRCEKKILEKRKGLKKRTFEYRRVKNH